MSDILDYPNRTLSDAQKQRLGDAVQKIRLATRLLFILAGFELVLTIVRYRIGIYDTDGLIVGLVVPMAYGACGFAAMKYPLPSLAIAFLVYLGTTAYALLLVGSTDIESLLWRGVVAIVLIVGLVNALQAHRIIRSIQQPE
jgi:hypothetical protein